MALTQTTTGPLGTTRTISIPNNKIQYVAECFGIDMDDYESELSFEQAIIQAIILHEKKPIIRKRKQELSSNPDITDVITES